ncbi:hypothetical protein LI177_13490 [bacterium 210820-DFI.6.37]|nr:hypothetical protein [bacterium 210820-DFI.6.37]
MKTIDLQVNGKPLIFTGKSVSYAGYELFYSKMSNIAHRGGEKPAYVFDYDGKRLALPYDPKDKEITLKIFKQVALMEKKRAALAEKARLNADAAPAAQETESQQTPQEAPAAASEEESAPAVSEEDKASEANSAEEAAADTEPCEAGAEESPEPDAAESTGTAEPEDEKQPAPALAPEEEEFTMYYVPEAQPEADPEPKSESKPASPQAETNTEPDGSESASDFTLFDVPSEQDAEKKESPAVSESTDALFDAFALNTEQTASERPDEQAGGQESPEPQRADSSPAQDAQDTDTSPVQDAGELSTAEEKPKKPLYKRGWFIFILILVLIGIISLIVSCIGINNYASSGGTASASAASTETGATYESILNDYSKQMEEATPKLIEQYESEAKQTTGSVDELSQLSTEKVSELAKINLEGTEAMAALMTKNSDDYETYEKWADKLYKVYDGYAAEITDAYMDSAL